MNGGRPGLISGVVRDADGAPVEDARVYVADAPVPIPDVAALTGTDGRFSLPAPADGSYTLEASADGLGSARVTVEARGAADVELTMGTE